MAGSQSEFRVSLSRAAGQHELVGNIDISGMQKRKLAETRTDQNRSFSFGSDAPGRYIVTSKTTAIHLVLIAPDKGENDGMKIEDHDDCVWAGVAIFDGKSKTWPSNKLSRPWNDARY